jgi:hypothetical protein
MKSMEENKIFYLKYPLSEFAVVIFILLTQPILVILMEKLFGNTIFIIIWINLTVLFFCYHLLKLLLVNIFKHSYILFNKEGIKCVNPFNRIIKFYWNDYKGHILIDNILMIQFGVKNIKIVNSFLKNGNINEIINIIEEYKVDIKYNK